MSRAITTSFSSDGTYTYSYDAEGNQTARWVNNSSGSETEPSAGDTDITLYTWDNRNRLTSVTQYADYDSYHPESGSPTPDLTVTYIYDAFNRWIGETITSGRDDAADPLRLRWQPDHP